MYIIHIQYFFWSAFWVLIVPLTCKKRISVASGSCKNQCLSPIASDTICAAKNATNCLLKKCPNQVCWLYIYSLKKKTRWILQDFAAESKNVTSTVLCQKSVQWKSKKMEKWQCRKYWAALLKKWMFVYRYMYIYMMYVYIYMMDIYI